MAPKRNSRDVLLRENIAPEANQQSCRGASKTESFAEKLHARASSVENTPLKKVVDEIKERCQRESEKGLYSTVSFFFDFVGDTEPVLVALEELHLQVVSLMITSRKHLRWEVSWGTPNKKPRKEDDAKAGNLVQECKICGQECNARRLHPCGHLLGVCCLQEVVGKKCPFCREEVIVSQKVFKP